MVRVPCHGSQYNQAGEKKAGPAPGMDRFATAVSGGKLSVDTGLVIQGPPIGTNTTGQEAEGPTASAVDLTCPQLHCSPRASTRASATSSPSSSSLGFFVYVFINVRRGRAEVGAELELAANRKPYYDDETPRARSDRALTWGLILLGVIADPALYWLNEPGRQDGAVQDFNRKFTDRGSSSSPPPRTALNCAGCHGPEGVGGVANYTSPTPTGTSSTPWPGRPRR